MGRDLKFDTWNDTKWRGHAVVLQDAAEGQPSAPTAPTEWWSDSSCNCAPPSTVALHATAELPPMSTGTFTFGASPPDPGAKALADMDENEILSALLYCPELFQCLFGPLNYDRPRFWVAIGLHRRDLGLPDAGKPGDIDVLLGPMVGRAPDFTRLVGVEVKVRRAKQGDPGNSPSFGTKQARGLLELGCDRAALVHIVVAHQVADAAWIHGRRSIGSLFGMDLTRAVSALAHGTAPHRDARLGYMVAAWGHAAGKLTAREQCPRGLPARPPGPQPSALLARVPERERQGPARTRRSLEHAQSTRSHHPALLPLRPRCPRPAAASCDVPPVREGVGSAVRDAAP